MLSLTIRNDDINAYSDLNNIHKIYDIIRERFPQARIISGVSILAKTNNTGNVYPESPLRGKATKYFYNVDSFLNKVLVNLGEIASHGLLHIDHSKLSYDAQEMSIVASCNYLNSKLFIAPFNGYNKDTLKICKRNGIDFLTLRYKWLSLEFNEFDPNHKYWYFHSWRYSVDRFKREIMKWKYQLLL